MADAVTATAKPAGDPAARRKRRAGGEIRALILAAAVEEFQAGGFAGATTAAIARRAGVTETQIFRYFESKASLFREAVFAPLNEHFDDFRARLGAGFGDASPAGYIRELQQFIRDHSRLLMTLIVAQAHGHEAGAGEKPLEGLAAYFERGAATMRGRLGDRADAVPISPELMVRISFAAVMGCALFGDWMIPEDLASAEAIGAAITAFTIDGLNANS